MSRLKNLGKDSLIYGIGGVIAKSISFFLLPVYTQIFSVSEYGNIEMLTIITSFLSAILAMGMDSTQSMYFFKIKKKGKNAQARIISSILQLRLAWVISIIFIATLCSPFINSFFFHGKLSWEYFAIAFMGSLFMQIMSQSAEVMRLLFRPFSYLGITLSQSIFSAVLILSLVIFFDQGIKSFFIGTAISSLILGIFGWIKIRDYWQFDSMHINLWPMLVRFGLPLMPAGIAMYFMSSADRWFIQYYHGPESLGLFAIGAKFALLLTLAVEAFRTAWWPIAMDSMHSKDGPKTFQMIARLYMGICSAALAALTLISPWLLKWMTAIEFHDAWPIIGILSWQSVFYGFFSIASAGIWKTEKTYLNLYLMIGATIIGLLLNWLLVPIYGIMGAAIATIITYLIWIIISIIVSELLWKVNFSWKILFFQIILGQFFVFWFINNKDLYSFNLLVLVTLLVIILELVSSFEILKIKFYLKFFKVK